MDAAHIDFETGSPTDLKAAGVHRYAEDRHTRVWVFRWRIGDGPTNEWRPGSPDPLELLEHIALGGKVVAHNAGFERIIWNRVLLPRYVPHWPAISVEQQECTMARALAVGLPGKLEVLGDVLGTAQKDMVGAAHMRTMMRPKGYAADGTPLWRDSEADVVKLSDYCRQDVEVECAVDRIVPPLTPDEQALWEFDQHINDRGVQIDVAAVRGAADLAMLARKAADREMRRITGGAVRKCTEVAKLVLWLRARGIPCDSFRKGDRDELVFHASFAEDADALSAIRLRILASKTSVAKYARMLKCVCEDGRIRGLLQYYGARTGRWAGRLVQPQNFPRFDHENDTEVMAVTWMTVMLAEGVPAERVFESMEFVHGAVLPWLSKALRSVIIAAPGRKLVGGDFSNIEGRVNAWKAGEEWKINAFRAYDAKTGPDLYKLAYSTSFGVLVEEVSKAQRQIGKVQELALGYQGGVGAFISMGANYNIEPYDIAKVVFEAVDGRLWDETAARYARATDKCGLQEFEWTALKIIVTGWRRAHPNIVQSWWDLQDAAIAAVDCPHTIVPVGDGRYPVRYMSDGNYLYCALPSGRVLAYASPFVKQERVVRVNRKGEEYETTQRSVRFWGRDDKGWTVLPLYGGLQCENVVQATARDLMVPAMFRAERAGYPVILTVHDEILTEPDADHGSAAEFEALMSELPPWAAGLPLAAAAWEDQRYVK